MDMGRQGILALFWKNFLDSICLQDLIEYECIYLRRILESKAYWQKHVTVSRSMLD
jgi:hypothetical protein